MKPHELASQIHHAEVPEGGPRTIEGLSGLLDASQGVWRELNRGKFEEDENGHLRFDILDWSTELGDSSDHVDAIVVEFEDPNGFRTKLGKVERARGSGGKGRALAYPNVVDTQGEEITPSDERWDVIVGSIGRAIKQSKSAE